MEHHPRETMEEAVESVEGEEEVPSRARDVLGRVSKSTNTGPPISSSLGAMVSLIEKLHMLLLNPPQGCFRLPKEGINLLKDVETLREYLEDLSELVNPPPTAKCWMNEARDLSYRMDDYIDNILFAQPQVPSFVASNIKTTRSLRKFSRNVKTPKIQNIIVEPLAKFRIYVQEALERHKRYGLYCCSTLRRRFVSLGPMLPVQYDEEAANIVVDGQMNELINSLEPDDGEDQQQLKTVSVLGPSCLGKTTLAKALYNRTGKQYHCRAFVQVSKKPDMKRIFRDMLSQLTLEHPPKDCKEVDLVDKIKEYLQNKWYLIIIDDLWSASVWDIINRALPKGCHSSRIITTTQFEDVALRCCRYQSQHVFEMKPLDDDYSRNLFFSRIFGSESHCPKQFKEILREIVEICGGLPLATMSIASLLASQPVMTEDLLMHIRKSLSSCFSASSTSEKTRQALNLSFINLPQYLKTCLLYLSMYQKGYKFCKDDLVRQWISEGFINTVEGQDMVKVAESYLDQLIGRRFIRPICINYNNEVLSCEVHDTVHDLIAHKAAEENFIVAIDYSEKNVALPHKARRLSLLFGDARYAKTPVNIIKSQVRSLAFSGILECMPCITEFKLLRVLNLQLSGHGGDDDSPVDLTGISELFKLIYLKVSCDFCIILPNHLLLETLDIMDARVIFDPWDIRLPHLLHLGLPIDRNLSDLSLGMNSFGYLQDLNLTISSTTPSFLGSGIEDLSSLIRGHGNLKTVVVAHSSSVKNIFVRGASKETIYWNHMEPPPLLQKFEFSLSSSIFSRIPPWFEKHDNLCILKIAVRELLMNCIGILKGLRALTSLSLSVETAPTEKIIFHKDGFSVLKYFKLRLRSGIALLNFEADAMPNLLKLKLVFNAITQLDKYEHGIISIEHMPGLREISTKFEGAASDLEYVSRIGVVSNHPSNPIIDVQLVDSGSHGDECTRQKHEPDEILEEKVYHKALEILADKRISPSSPESSSRPYIPAPVAGGLVSDRAAYPWTSSSSPYLVSASTGVLSLLGKLGAMLSDEYKMLKGVRGDIQFLKDELDSMHTFLLNMADVEEPPKQNELYANAVRELSFDMEDKIDKFMVLVDHEPSSMSDSFKELFTNSSRKIRNIKDRHKIARDVKDIESKVAEVRARHERYTIDPSLRSKNEKVDPRLHAIYGDAAALVGIDGPTNVLLKWLSNQEGESAYHHGLKVISIVGSGGLGKTTLARQVYDKLGANYDCRAFVSSSRTPNFMTILRSILSEISNGTQSDGESIEEIIGQIREFLKDKRYFIIIDDIWDTKAWEILKSALVRNDCGSAIMTTTRKIDVAKSCCSSDEDLVYEMQPLGVADSKKLFFKRIFDCEEKCPPNLKEASDDILKKCGGLPLAINAIASLLATRREQKLEWWDHVRRSIGLAHGKNSEIADMKYILSLSYSDLPHYLKTCLLYLAMFPEDYEIERQRLVHRWIAEGLVHGGDEEDLVELGEEYFHDLVNRSLIQPVGIGYDGMVRCCRVHDVVLDFLICMFAEENFSTLLSNNPGPDCRVRRTSLMGNEDQASVEKLDLSHARSLGSFGNDTKQLPSLGKSNADLYECFGLKNHHVKDIGRFLQLRYLNIGRTGITNLPAEIGDLEYLETLILNTTNLQELPESVTRLERLTRLFVGEDTIFPDGIGNMKNLQELRIIDALKQSVKFLEELGELTNLRDLMIKWVCTSESREASYKEKALVSSLRKLDTCKLHNLSIELWLPEEDETFIGCSFFPDLSSIREIRLGSGWITEWMLSLMNLERLHLFSFGHEIKQQDVEMVGSIPTLLEFGATNAFVGSIIISEGFQRLRKFDICAHTTDLTFEAGALPNLQELIVRWVGFELCDSAKLTFEAGTMLNVKEFTLWIRLDKFESAGAGLDFGIQNLVSLERLRVVIDCAGEHSAALEMERAEVVFKRMADAHPKRPTLKMMKGYNYSSLHDEE